VRGVVTCIFLFYHIFFFEYHEQLHIKPDFVVISKSPLFAAETAENCSITFWFFLSVRNGGENSRRRSFFYCGRNSRRMDRSCSVFFEWREKILCVHVCDLAGIYSMLVRQT
jgi:hypothetical protein